MEAGSEGRARELIAIEVAPMCESGRWWDGMVGYQARLLFGGPPRLKGGAD